MGSKNGIKRIVLVNQHTAYIFIDIANSFANRYDEVVLMAGVIHPLGVELNPKIKVHKIVPYYIGSSYKRLFSWLVSTVQVYFALLFKYRKFECFFYSNPPLLSFLSLLLKRKITHLIVDVYPDALLSAGFISGKKNMIYRCWSFLLKFSLPRFHKIYTITAEMRDRLSVYLDYGKIEVVPLWANSFLFEPNKLSNDNLFLTKYKLLPNKFYVIYSGNLGAGHNVEYLIDLAINMISNNNVYFIIAGDGYKRELLENKLEHNKLTNCILIPYQEEKIFLDMLKIMSLGVVTIDDKMAYVSIPSKTYNLLGAGRPLLCFGLRDSDLGKLVTENNCGIILDNNNVILGKDFIDQLLSDPAVYQSYVVRAINTAKGYTSINANKFVEGHMNLEV